MALLKRQRLKALFHRLRLLQIPLKQYVNEFAVTAAYLEEGFEFEHGSDSFNQPVILKNQYSSE